MTSKCSAAEVLWGLAHVDSLTKRLASPCSPVAQNATNGTVVHT